MGQVGPSTLTETSFELNRCIAQQPSAEMNTSPPKYFFFFFCKIKRAIVLRGHLVWLHKVLRLLQGSNQFYVAVLFSVCMLICSPCQSRGARWLLGRFSGTAYLSSFFFLSRTANPVGAGEAQNFGFISSGSWMLQ